VGEKEEVTRLVLDTNVLVSALLFRSEASALFDAWRGGRFRLAVSEPIRLCPLLPLTVRSAALASASWPLPSAMSHLASYICLPSSL